jgi:hypothetical protein
MQETVGMLRTKRASDLGNSTANNFVELFWLLVLKRHLGVHCRFWAKCGTMTKM